MPEYLIFLPKTVKQFPAHGVVIFHKQPYLIYTLLPIFCPKTNLTITEFESGCNLSLVINCTTAVNCCSRLSFIAVANCTVPECFATNPLGKEDVFIKVPFGA